MNKTELIAAVAALFFFAVCVSEISPIVIKFCAKAIDAVVKFKSCGIQFGREQGNKVIRE